MENKIEMTSENYDYLCMFIHLSHIEDEYLVGDLVNGVVNLTKLSDNTQGYIYITTDGSLYIFYNNESTYFGNM